MTTRKQQLNAVLMNYSYTVKEANVSLKLIQDQIAAAYRRGNMILVKELQRTVINDSAIQTLAVITVARSNGAFSPGIDGFVMKEREHIAEMLERIARVGLKPTGYKATPVRRIEIPKPGTNKMRPIGIPTIFDRCVQQLFTYCLAPIAEAVADKSSYGFRPMRGTQDAIHEARHVVATASQMIFDADISKFFDTVSHEWLLEFIPLHPHVLREFLKAGYVFNSITHETSMGFPQGGIISPMISNMVLDGLTAVVLNSVKGWKSGRYVRLVRYADDFIVSGPRFNSVWDDRIIPAIRNFLSVRGLKLSEEKSKLVTREQGFDFLGFTLQWVPNKMSPGKYMLLCQPSSKSVQRMKDKLRDFFKRNQQANASTIINNLNPILRGWGNYCQYGTTSEIFHDMDYYLDQLVHKWARRKYKELGAKEIYRNQFHTVNGRRTLAYLENGKVISLIRLRTMFPVKRYEGKLFSATNQAKIISLKQAPVIVTKHPHDELFDRFF